VGAKLRASWDVTHAAVIFVSNTKWLFVNFPTPSFTKFCQETWISEEIFQKSPFTGHWSSKTSTFKGTNRRLVLSLAHCGEITLIVRKFHVNSSVWRAVSALWGVNYHQFSHCCLIFHAKHLKSRSTLLWQAYHSPRVTPYRMLTVIPRISKGVPCPETSVGGARTPKFAQIFANVP